MRPSDPVGRPKHSQRATHDGLAGRAITDLAVVLEQLHVRLEHDVGHVDVRRHIEEPEKKDKMSREADEMIKCPGSIRKRGTEIQCMIWIVGQRDPYSDSRSSSSAVSSF
jgi:hypothetical protein